MKKLFFIPVLALFVACEGSNEVEVGNKTTMEVEKEFNAGTVVKGEIVYAVFKVRNTGKYPLVIASVEGSCSCTVASKPEDPIQPGESAEIKAEVNTDKTPSGQITKPVTLVANTEPSIQTLLIKANVKNK